MDYITNSTGCQISAAFHRKSDFLSLARLTDERQSFIETIKHRLVDATFWEGRKVCLSIAGTRTLNVPKKCKTLREVAEWINTKDF